MCRHTHTHTTHTHTHTYTQHTHNTHNTHTHTHTHTHNTHTHTHTHLSCTYIHMYIRIVSITILMVAPLVCCMYIQYVACADCDFTLYFLCMYIHTRIHTGHSQTVPRGNYQHHQLRVANGNTLVSPGKQDVWLDQHFGSHHHGNAGTGFNSASYSHPHHHMQQQPGDRTRYNLQSGGGYHGNHTSQGSYGSRPDSRGAGSYPSSGDHVSRGHSSRSQQLKDVRSGMPSAYLGSSFGALTHLPPSATPSSPSATQEEGRKDVRQRSRSLGRSASGEDPSKYIRVVWGAVCVSYVWVGVGYGVQAFI